MSQYDEIRKALKRSPKRGCSTRELLQRTSSNCPWKRISEMRIRGEKIESFDRPEKGGGTIVAYRMAA